MLQIDTGASERLELLDALASDIRRVLAKNAPSDGSRPSEKVNTEDLSVHWDLIRHLLVKRPNSRRAVSPADREWSAIPGAKHPIRVAARSETVRLAVAGRLV